MSELRTSRLNLDRVDADDAAFVLELLNDPGWLANIGDRGVHSLDEARAYIAERFDRSYWLVARGAATGEALGLCGIVAARPGLDISDLGYAFLARHSGKGYATEASQAVLTHAFRALGHERLAAITTLSNVASQRVLEKLGFRRMGVRRLPDYADDSAYFEIP